MMRIVLAAIFLLMAAPCPCLGQTELHDHEELLSQAFEEGPSTEEVSDPFRVLRHNPELKAELTQAIRKLEEKYKFRIRVIMRPVWMGGTVQELAVMLQDVWFPKGDGLVMIIETDNRKLGLGMSMHGDPEDKDWLIPTHASAILLKRVADRVNHELPLDEFLKSVVLDMVAEHEVFLAKRLARPSPVQALRENMFLIGALVAAALGTLMITLFLRLSQTKDDRRIRLFPTVSVPERLEAPYGGGIIASRKFDRSRS
jgi:uncharacterized membrane protein YgcG